MIPDLSPAFKKSLLIKAQNLNPIVRLGNKGLTPTVHHEVDLALEAHELVKIKISGATAEIRTALYDELSSTHHAVKIQKIGHIVVLYRKNNKKSD